MPSRASTFGPRGRKLWRDLHKPGEVRDAATDVLIEEACRIADRLDDLDRMIRDKSGEWFTFRADECGDVTVIVDNVLLEARQQASTLRGLLGPLTKKATDAAMPKREVSGSDDIAAQRAKRRSGSASP